MKQIRRNCFETNSSSMHSIAITKNSLPYSKYDKLDYMVEDNGLLDLYKYEHETDYYERYPFMILRSEEDKLKYVLGYYYSYDGKKTKENKADIEAIHKLVKTRYPEIKKIKDWADGTNWQGKDIKKYPITAKYNDTGESVFEFIKRKNLSIEDVIFNPTIIIFVDGDEYQETYKLFDARIIDENNIDDISSGINHWMRREFNFDISMINWTYFDGSTYLDVRKEDIMNFKELDKSVITFEFDCNKNGIEEEYAYKLAGPQIQDLLNSRAEIKLDASINIEFWNKYILGETK